MDSAVKLMSDTNKTLEAFKKHFFRELTKLEVALVGPVVAMSALVCCGKVQTAVSINELRLKEKLLDI